jgi:hypothetical protein
MVRLLGCKRKNSHRNRTSPQETSKFVLLAQQEENMANHKPSIRHRKLVSFIWGSISKVRSSRNGISTIFENSFKTAPNHHEWGMWLVKWLK